MTDPEKPDKAEQPAKPEKKLFETAQPLEVFRYVQRRDWELWSIGLLLMSVFAGGLLAYYYYGTTQERLLSPSTARFIWLVLFGLVALVILLNVYLIARKRALAELWRRYLLQQQELESEREQGMLDPLTQIYNRRFFDEMIPKEVRRSDRTGRPLSFLFIDIDDFKTINQEQGHFIGDELLRAVAGLVQDGLRTTDYAFRFGGDELLVALPETPAEGAAVVAGRLHKKVAAHSYLQERLGRPLTVSIGQATYARGQNLEAVIEAAERAMEAARTARAGTLPP